MVERRAPFPPSWVVVEPRDLVEPELLVVIGTDPLGGVERAFLECGVDVAAGDLLRHGSELAQHHPGETTDTDFESVAIGDVLDLLAEPTAHLSAGVAGRDPVD